MSLANKIMILLAATLGVICTLGAIIQLREVIHLSNKPSFLNAGIGLLFIALFIFAGLLIFTFVTLCCPCSHFIIGILGIITGTAALIFAIGSYASFMRPAYDARLPVPTHTEWTFGGIMTAVGVILVGITILLGD
ncbi:hypothetical protein P879_10960 [Paragonimus westermani]|uniref:Uncharacterized protein n=1 Tax=Paragonimus westermani TaxID=34504 RepID=A0A8T0DBA4_9TREM|nr:hypothetical protein P879_10960 [Paragonimus westermani]